MGTKPRIAARCMRPSKQKSIRSATAEPAVLAFTQSCRRSEACIALCRTCCMLRGGIRTQGGRGAYTHLRDKPPRRLHFELVRHVHDALEDGRARLALDGLALAGCEADVEGIGLVGSELHLGDLMMTMVVVVDTEGKG